MHATCSVFAVYQPPILQEVDLPEALGRIASLGQLVEFFSYGSGPLLAGLVLVTFAFNYRAAIQVIALIALTGISMWLTAMVFVEKDQARIKCIIGTRAKEVKDKAEASKDQKKG